MAARRLLLPSALVLLALSVTGCATEPGATADAGSPPDAPATSSTASQALPDEVPASYAPAQADAATPADAEAPAGAASPDAVTPGDAEPGQETSASLAELALRGPDLGTGWLTQKPDDRAADAAEHRFCGAVFSSDRDREQRVERNHARDDGLRVQQELNRYSTPAAAERAVQEYVDAFATCGRYEPQPGISVALEPAPAPVGAQQRTGARMTLTPTGSAPVHAALAVYRTGLVVTVVSVVAEQPATARQWIDPVTRAALRRARL